MERAVARIDAGAWRRYERRVLAAADAVVHAVTTPAHARVDTIEVQPVAPVESRDRGPAVP